jgi:hypothetical protein
MSTSASKRAQQAAEAHRDDDTVFCGMGRVQESGGSVYGLLPTPFSDNQNLKQGSPMQIAYHVPTGSFILTPVDG